ncbi:MAG: YqeG family HAD IIIA-type phosphatase [Firmicutes bacterium]|nr:YqeG family HAD IIIA-type phosphatase [Bacillota bacterium]
MFKHLCPNQFVENIYHINLEQLAAEGIRGIIADLDNTLVPWNDNELFPEVLEWIKEVKDRGFKVCIVSNNHSERGDDLAKALNVPAIWRAVKPRRSSFRKALRIMDLNPAKVAVIGDQVFTDILGGNRLGLHTILVRPLNKREFFVTRLIRHVERMILFILCQRGSWK